MYKKNSVNGVRATCPVKQKVCLCQPRHLNSESPKIILLRGVNVLSVSNLDCPGPMDVSRKQMSDLLHVSSQV